MTNEEKRFRALVDRVREHREFYERVRDERDKMWARIRAEMFGGPLIPPAVEEPQDEVTQEELVRWFVEHGWRSSWQDIIGRFLKSYRVVRRG